MEHANPTPMLFRFVGGKYYALKYLKKYWTVPHIEYREPFVGGGSIFFTKPKAEINWINDADEDLINTYRMITTQNMREKMLKTFRNETATRKRHSEIKASMPRSDVNRAIKFYYLNRTSFSGKMRNPAWGYKLKRSLPPDRWHERLVPCGDKLSGVKITHGDFEAPIVEPGKKVLMYIDPPYFVGRKNTHYSQQFDHGDHIRLAHLLKQTKHKFFLTYDDDPDIRKMYAWANVRTLDFVYRVEDSNNRSGTRRSGKELIISNYVPKEGFLSQIRTSIQRSPFRYVGSKYQAIRFIKPIWESIPHDEYREPLVGGGGILCKT